MLDAGLRQYQCAVGLLRVTAVVRNRLLGVLAPWRCPNAAVASSAARLDEADSQRLVRAGLRGDLYMPRPRRIGAEQLRFGVVAECVEQVQRRVRRKARVVHDQAQRARPPAAHERARLGGGPGAPPEGEIQHPPTVCRRRDGPAAPAALPLYPTWDETKVWFRLME